MRKSGILLALAVGLLIPGAPPEVAAQERGFMAAESRRAGPIREGLPEVRGGFMFCRLWYDSYRRLPRGLGWSTDYPSGDRNLMIRLSYLTPAPINRWSDGLPGHAVVRATDPDRFQCPFLFASDIGTAGFSPTESEGLREYLLKGGFLWVDDFWGNTAWDSWVRELEYILPEYEIIDLPLDHPLFSIVYQIEEVPQIPAFQFWMSTGGQTSELGAESATAHLRVIKDDTGRILVLMTHNTDIADGWEREGEGGEFFRRFSPPAYALGINVLIWVMSH
jgi:hypothetical protein